MTKKNWMIGTTIASVLLVSYPMNAAHAAESVIIIEENVNKSDSQPEQKVIDAAQQELGAFLNDSAVELEVEKNGISDISTQWIFNNKLGRGRILVDKKTGGIEGIFADYKWSALDALVKDAATQAIRKLDPNKTFAAESVSREKKFLSDGTVHEWVMTGKDMVVKHGSKALNVGKEIMITLDADTLKVKDATISYPFDKATDKKALNAGLNALKTMNGGTAVQLDIAIHYCGEHYDGWKFRDTLANYVVDIDSKTGKVTNISLWGKKEAVNKSGKAVKQDKKPFYTKNQAVAAAKPMVKKLFDIDLTGYDVTIKKDNYAFTKKGQPTVSANIDAKGGFWSYIVLEPDIK